MIITNSAQVYYYEILAFNVPGPSIFFNISTTAGQTGLSYIVALNDNWKLNSSNDQPYIYTDNPPTQEIEFTEGWLSNELYNSLNVLQINITQIIILNEYDSVQCAYTDFIIITNPPETTLIGSTGSSMIGDPQFMGLRGQSFQVHGIDGGIYNIISDPNFQFNSRFRFLEGPRPCPVIPSTNELSRGCWSHPGSYVTELGLITTDGSTLFIGAGSSAEGFAQITLHNRELEIGDIRRLGFANPDIQGMVIVNNTHELTIEAAYYTLVIENNDGFLNIRRVSVKPMYWSLLSSHGLLGQTWRNKRYPHGKIKDIEGDVDDYLIDDNNLFGDRFMYNRFPTGNLIPHHKT